MAEAVSLKNVRAAKSRVMAVFSELAEVVGVGITTVGAGYGLKVNLKSLPKSPSKLPTHVDDVPVTVEVVGPIRKRKSRNKARSTGTS